MSNELQQMQDEQELIQQLRARGDTASLQYANQVQKDYRDRQMEALSQDVYKAANGEGHPPLGWVRLSEHPELFRQYARDLRMSDAELNEALHSDQSGFRAEVYIPDPQILGPSFKPTVAFKGSSGEVKTSDGKHHDTTIEDFLGNNGPQSVGLETDYYDRAMGLGLEFKIHNIVVDFAGHSLAGGMASAAAAVTGYSATTFNAAGLHPLTAKRFCDQNNIPLYDASQHVTAYQVKGELLNDGVQGNIHAMDNSERAQLAMVLKEVSNLGTRLPDARHALNEWMQRIDLPLQAQQSTLAFMDKVAHGNADQLLRDLPLASGQVQLLEAMTRDAHGDLVPRDATMGLPELSARLAPVMEVLSVASLGARAGDTLGAVTSLPQHLGGNVLHGVGANVRHAGELRGEAAQINTQMDGEMRRQTEHVAVAAAAHARVAGAEISAQIDQAVGHARQWGTSLDAAVLRGIGHVVTHDAQQRLAMQADALERTGQRAVVQGAMQATADRLAGEHDAAALRRAGLSAEHATTAFANDYGQAQHDASAQAGEWVGRQLDGAGNAVQRVGDYQHEAFTATGAAVTGLSATGVALSTAALPSGQAHLNKAVDAVRHAAPTGNEAFQRHLMGATVAPSMDYYVQQREAAAREYLQHTPSLERPPHAPVTEHAPSKHEAAAKQTPSIPDHLRDFRHPDHPMQQPYQRALTKVHAMEDLNKVPHGEHSERMAAALVDTLHEARFGSLDRLELRGAGKHAQVVAHQSRPSVYMPERDVSVSVEHALSRTVGQRADDWSKRAMPHVHEPLPAIAAEWRPDPRTLPPHDLRHPDHPQHALYRQVHTHVADAYGKAGIPRSDTQLEHATAATLLQAQVTQVDWTQGNQVFVAQDRASGVIGPQSPLVIRQPDHVYGYRNDIVPAQAMQHAPEHSFQQMGQVAQQQAHEHQQFEMQRAHVGAQTPAMGLPGGGR
ncbi:hypothetical protein EKH79_18435 [Dyella dinghuensis]|uniref:X-Tfes XVIPCD domain-containing protein n=1 Tax=Dyella dinghuensis TaxID=1920169 RepID=A0A432LP30_9GAMM|nr:XVIPCD domain-containing protein [Dyella dinghuensis]RUL61606.1 hypothetical protein EKH79_18435 [Dyella dinghuensis]